MSTLISREEGLRIITEAKRRFAGTDRNGNPLIEWRRGSDGTDTDGNGIPELDCSEMVYRTLEGLGYNVSDFGTGFLNSDASAKYFGKVENMSDVREGDLIVFDGHVGIVESIWYDSNLRKYVGRFFHSERYAGGATTSDFILDPSKNWPGYVYGDSNNPITKFLRPKESIHNIMSYQEWFIIEHTHQLYGVTKKVQSPIALDLDGDGIETVNINDSAHFDHDANGFAEQTGWVGSDDGLLVYDRNNDGIIDTGRETFGNTTLLSNGTPADNGFQALAELDGNKDGKIDENDTIWTSLKVWQDYDGDGYSSGKNHGVRSLILILGSKERLSNRTNSKTSKYKT